MAKQIKKEQAKKERQPELHKCHTPEEIVMVSLTQ